MTPRTDGEQMEPRGTGTLTFQTVEHLKGHLENLSADGDTRIIYLSEDSDGHYRLTINDAPAPLEAPDLPDPLKDNDKMLSLLLALGALPGPALPGSVSRSKDKFGGPQGAYNPYKHFVNTTGRRHEKDRRTREGLHRYLSAKLERLRKASPTAQAAGTKRYHEEVMATFPFTGRDPEVCSYCYAEGEETCACPRFE
jgi:hypothetical protein